MIVEPELKIGSKQKAFATLNKPFLNDFFRSHRKASSKGSKSIFDNYFVVEDFMAGNILFHFGEKSNNPAFDFCHIFDYAEKPGVKILLHVETRYSHPKEMKERAAPVDFEDDIYNKHQLLVNGYKKGNVILLTHCYITSMLIVFEDEAKNSKIKFDNGRKLIEFKLDSLKEHCKMFNSSSIILKLYIDKCESIMPVLVVAVPRQRKSRDSKEKHATIDQMIENINESFVPVVLLDLDGLQSAYGPSICSTQLFNSQDELNLRYKCIHEA